MRKCFAALDDLLIERLFQPASDLMSQRAGVTRGTAACFCLDIASVAWIVARAKALSAAVITWNAATATSDAALLLLGLLAMVALRTLFRRAGAKSANPLRLAMRPHRAVALLMLVTDLAQSTGAGASSIAGPASIVHLSSIADIAMLIAASAALYLGACAERPKLRRGITRALAPAL